MARDLFLGETNISWSRGESPSKDQPMSDEVTLKLTDEERDLLSKIVTARMKASSGDKAAKAQLAKFKTALEATRDKAAMGDKKAQRTLKVLVESGAFNKPQKIDMSAGWFGAKEDSHTKDRRAERYETELNQTKDPKEILSLGKMIAFNPEYNATTTRLAAQGNTTAKSVLEAASKYVASMHGDAAPNNKMNELRAQIQKLYKKDPKTEEDRRTIDLLTEKLTRLEVMSGDFIGRHHGNPQARLQRKVTRLKTKASAGDTQAATRLQNMQSRLASKAAAGDTRAAARLQEVRTDLALPTTTVPGAPPAAPAPMAPTTWPTTSPTTYPTNYQASYPQSSYYPSSSYYQQPQYAYQSPYFDPSLSQDPYGPAPQPTIDVYQGDEEASALAGDGGNVERAALRRSGRMSGIGAAISNTIYRATVQKYARKKAGHNKPTTKDIFLAKAAVDNAIGKAGISLYMPGAQPGRRTI